MKNKDFDNDIDERKIGMDKPIERRDVLQGAAFSLATAASGLLPGQAFGASADTENAAQNQPDYYPPIRTGMRGSHPGSFESGHAVRDNPGLLLSLIHI